jgi:hypothetical protein
MRVLLRVVEVLYPHAPVARPEYRALPQRVHQPQARPPERIILGDEVPGPEPTLHHLVARV